MDFQYHLKSDVDRNLINFDLLITHWDSRGMILKMNFTEPSLVSID